MFGDVPLVLVEDGRALEQAVAAFAQHPAIAVDLEADSFHRYREKVCLVQVSIPGVDYVIDTLALEDLGPLGSLLEDPAIGKVLHGSDYDVVSLKRDYGVQIRGLFDTMIAAQFLSLPKFGLADLLSSTFAVTVDKRYQRHDWSRRPLMPEHIEYARGDTHWLLAMREVLQYRLDRAGWSDAVAEECRLLEKREWQGRVVEPGDFLRIKGTSALDLQSKRVLRALYEYREGQARNMDRPVFKVIPDAVLAAVARRKPRDLEAMQGLVRRGSALMRQHGASLVAAVAAGLDDERSLPPVPAGKQRTRAPGGSSNPHVVELLRAWRTDTVARDGIAPALIAPNAVLRQLARVLPASKAQLEAIPELRNWQVQRYGVDLLRVVAEGVEASKPATKSKRRRRRRRKKPVTP